MIAMRHAAAWVAASSCFQLAAAMQNSIDRHRPQHGVQNRTPSALTMEYPYYHTSDELLSKVTKLADSCSGATLTLSKESRNGTAIDVVRIKNKQANVVNKMFVLFGEHSRELISPESGLVFMEMLCGQADSVGNVEAHEVLKHSEFLIVLNGNPNSRRKVEQGEFCLRVNENGVDLNRNWAYKWQEPGPMDVADTYPGPQPFSEPETQIFKDLLEDYKPDTFLTIHSGTFGMYMPWAYDTVHLGTVNQKPMLEILEDIDDRHCQCPFGAAGKEVGYACPGTCLDYAYDVVKTPFVFAFEIYTSPEYELQLKGHWDETQRTGGSTLIKKGEHLAHPHFLDLFRKHKSDFVHVGPTKTPSLRASAAVDELDTCFRMFNPASEEEFMATTATWASVYMEVAASVTEKLQSM